MVTIAVMYLTLTVTPTVMTSDIDMVFPHSSHNLDHDHKDKDGNGISNKKAEHGIIKTVISRKQSGRMGWRIHWIRE